MNYKLKVDNSGNILELENIFSGQKSVTPDAQVMYTGKTRSAAKDPVKDPSGKHILADIYENKPNGEYKRTVIMHPYDLSTDIIDRGLNLVVEYNTIDDKISFSSNIKVLNSEILKKIWKRNGVVLSKVLVKVYEVYASRKNNRDLDKTIPMFKKHLENKKNEELWKTFIPE